MNNDRRTSTYNWINKWMNEHAHKISYLSDSWNSVNIAFKANFSITILATFPELKNSFVK